MTIFSLELNFKVLYILPLTIKPEHINPCKEGLVVIKKAYKERFMKLNKAIIPLAIFHGMALADHVEPHKLDAIAVTASRDARPTQEISQGISVIDQETIDNWNVLNVQEALQHMPGLVTKSTSGGYSSRLAIRGAGIKAPYGVRAISVLRDGVPVTDPDGFARMDFIDPQDMAQVEVVKGPGSIYSYGSSGGTIQILSRSVFDTGSDRVRVGGGSYNGNTQNIRYSGNMTEDDFYALTWSRQDSPNTWREGNNYDRNNASFKYGHLFEDDSKFEMEIAYTNSHLDLPQKYKRAEYDIFAAGGDARWDLDTDGAYPYRHRARDSNVVFFNSSYEKQFGAITIKPRAYMNYWDHWHPTSGPGLVTKQIVLGGDFQLDWDHTLFDREAKMIVGAVGRNDRGRNEKYNYADKVTYVSRGTTKLDYTLSEKPGTLQSKGDEDNFNFGGYIQYSFEPIEKLKTDLSFRYDRIHLNVHNEEINQFDYSAKLFTKAGRGTTDIDPEYDIFSSRFGVSYAVMDSLNVYGNFAYGDQTPGASEVKANILAGRSTNLMPSSTYMYETGLKFREDIGTLDVSLYYADVENEILAGTDGNDLTYYINAGASTKWGIEVASQAYVGNIFPMIGETVPFLKSHMDALSLGVNYTWQDHVISEWIHTDDDAGTTTDYSGNTFGKIPRHMYSLFATYNHPSGFNASLRSRVQSKYHMNNENAAGKSSNKSIYGGLNFITDATVSYTYGPHTLQGNMNNIFDKRYAADAGLSNFGKSYEKEEFNLAAPRTWMVTYQYNF